METVLITGGTGMVGKALTEHLIKQNYQVIILTRNPATAALSPSPVRYAHWNPDKGIIDLNALAEADHIVNLAGAGVADKKWTRTYKQLIRSSRINSGQLIVKSLRENKNKVKSVISASATGWYGPDKSPGALAEENAPAYHDFLGETCALWEKSITPVISLQKRLIILRFGIVLSNTGGYFKAIKKAIQFRMAPIFGNGKQMVSWIHIQDLCSMISAAIQQEGISGIYNAVSPNPVNNQTFINTIKNQDSGLLFRFHVPALLLRLMLGESSVEVLKSVSVGANKILHSGFTFKFPKLENAIAHLYLHKD